MNCRTLMIECCITEPSLIVGLLPRSAKHYLAKPLGDMKIIS